jgi:phosphotransferase system enzyme I (PtsI)
MRIRDTKAGGTGTAEAAADSVLEGLGVGRGVSIGIAVLHETGAVNVAEYRVPASRIEAERQRFQEAVEASGLQIDRLRQESRALPPAAAEELGYLLDAYRQMLGGSRLVRGVDRRILEDQINAEAAVQHEIGTIVAGFMAMEDAYLSARAQDIRDVGHRLLRNLVKTPERPFTRLPRNAVILAEELTPADTALLDPKKVCGFATVLGGAESHTAIVARSLGIPAVLGVATLTKTARNGDVVIIDGSEGRVFLRPSEATLAHYRKRRADFLRDQRSLARLKNVPAITRDGAVVNLQANIELPGDCEAALQAGAQGIGLLRSEFLFMNRPDLPDEEEQYANLRQVVEAMGGKPVTIRTLDAGSDKLAPALGLGQALNPALGLRAIRLSLQRPELLDAQLAAILRAGAHGPVRILIPMVSTVEEMRQTRQIMDDTVRRLKRRRVPIADPLPPVGVMIEVPGAALGADALAWHSDFFAIGTNDLTQYTLAIDRADEAVAHLYNPLHPAVLRLIQFATEAALRARMPVSLCGEMAGDPRFTALLLGLGIRDLSMSASNIPRVKKRVRGLDLIAATRRARVIMDQSDTGRIRQLLEDFDQAE